MDVHCPSCCRLFDAPKEYKGRKVKCPFCKKSTIASPCEPVPIRIVEPKQEIVPYTAPHRVPKAAGDFLVKAWVKSPTAYKTGFLATLGALSALVLSIYVYGHFIFAVKPTLMDSIKSTLSKNELYLVNPIGERGIPIGERGKFRGRFMDEYKFSPDVTRSMPKFSVWLDENGALAGICAIWYGNYNGFPIDSDEDAGVFFTHDAVCNGFESLTKFNSAHLTAEVFEIDKRRPEEEFSQNKKGKWKIQVTRQPEYFIRPGRSFQKICQLENVDPIVYHFIATAQNW